MHPKTWEGDKNPPKNSTSPNTVYPISSHRFAILRTSDIPETLDKIFQKFFIIKSNAISFMETFKNEQFNENPNERMKLMDHALQFGNTNDLEALFDQGMDINQTDFEGRTALMMSAVKGKKDDVEMLIRRGADVNCVFMYQDRLPKTALDAARECRKAEIEKILIEHGAKTGSELYQSQ